MSSSINLIIPGSDYLYSYSLNEIKPSPLVSNNIKKSDSGPGRKSPGVFSPGNDPSRIKPDSDGGKTGTTALIRSLAVINVWPSGNFTDAK